MKRVVFRAGARAWCLLFGIASGGPSVAAESVNLNFASVPALAAQGDALFALDTRTGGVFRRQGNVFVVAGPGGAQPSPAAGLVAVDGGAFIFTRGQTLERVNTDGARSVLAGHGARAGQLRDPAGLVLSSRGRLYVADRGNDRVSVFSADGVYLFQTGDKKTLRAPFALAVDSGERVHVLDDDGRRLTIFDHAGRIVRTLAPAEIGAKNERLRAIAAYGARVFVASAQRVLELNAVTGGLERAHPVENARDLVAIAVAGDRLYVADNAARAVYVQDVAKTVTVADATPRLPNATVGVAVPADCDWAHALPQGEVLCLRKRARELTRLAQDGSVVFRFPAKIRVPRGLHADGDEVAVLDDDRVRVFASDGKSRFEIGAAAQSGKLDRPADVFLGKHLLVADTGNRRVQVYTRDGEFIRFIVPTDGNKPLRRPVAVAEDAEGRTYVADDSAKRIFVFAPGGTPVHALGGDKQFSAIFDLAIGADGELYVLGATPDNPARVVVFAGEAEVFAFGAGGAGGAGGTGGAGGAGDNALGRPVNLSFSARDRAALAVFDAEARRLKVFFHHAAPPATAALTLESDTQETRLSWPGAGSAKVTRYRVYCAADGAAPFRRLRELNQTAITLARDETRDCRAFRVSAISALGDEGGASETVTDRFPEAYSHFEMGRYAEAAAAFATNSAEQPKNPAPLRLLGKSRVANGEIEAAVAAFQQLAALPGRAAEGATLAGEAWLAIGEYQRAYATVEQLTSSDGADAALLSVCGRAALALGKFDTAAQCLAPAAKRDAANPELRLLLGQAYARLGDMLRAMRELDAALDAAPGDAKVWQQAADIHYGFGRFQEATVRYRRAQALDVNLTNAYLGELRAQLALGDEDAARAVADKFARGQEWARDFGMALIDLHAGKPDEAIPLLERVAPQAPNESGLILALAEARLRRDDLNGARAALADWIKSHPRDPEPHVALGRIAEAGGQFAQAQAHYERALMLLPSNGAAQLGIARAHFARRQLTEAQTAAQEAIRLDRPSVEPYLLAAEISRARGDPDGAIRHATDAASLDTRDARPYVLLGKIWLERKDYDAAIKAWEKAVALDPSASNLATLEAAKSARKNAPKNGNPKKNRRQ